MFETKFSGRIAFIGLILWATIAGIYLHASYNLIPSDIKHLQDALANTTTIGTFLKYAHINTDGVNTAETEFGTVCKIASFVHIAVGVMVLIQAAMFGYSDGTPGAFSVFTFWGFIWQALIITGAVFVNLFFFVTGFAVSTVSSVTAAWVISGVMLSLFANGLMVTSWEVMLWSAWMQTEGKKQSGF